MQNNIIIQNSITEIIKSYCQKKISPIDVANASIQNYNQYENIVEAWKCYDPDLLIKKANEADFLMKREEKISSLLGIPVGIKDIINTSEFPTQMGSILWKDFRPGNDARVVSELKYNGAIVPGKTVTAEFAVHTLGETKNPFNLERTPGTSSSGSAVAVACGMVPVSIGTQTAGSIIRPASYCGVYGFKPSYGVIPRTGVLKTTDTLDTIGYFCHHGEDLRLILDCIRVKGNNYPISNHVYNLSPHKKTNFKLGIISSESSFKIEPYALKMLKEWKNRFSGKSQFNINDITLPSCIQDVHEVHSTIYHKSLSYYFKEEKINKHLLSSSFMKCVEHGENINLDTYKSALRQQVEISKIIDNLLTEYDAIITLSTNGIAPLRDEKEGKDLCLLWTLSHVPVINIPVFKYLGMPLGLQIVSKKYSDYKLLEILDELIFCGMAPIKSTLILSKEEESLNNKLIQSPINKVIKC